MSSGDFIVILLVLNLGLWVVWGIHAYRVITRYEKISDELLDLLEDKNIKIEQLEKETPINKTGE